MTALAGFWTWGDAALCGPQCARMLQAQVLYGGEPAIREAGGNALGRSLRRLLPEDRFDRGPVAGADGTFLLVADLRIDNRPELARALGLSSGDEAGLADAELLARAYARWGEEVVERLVADFAFAAWHPAQQKLVLARDFLGRRPLYYHRGDAGPGGGFFAFSSMPKGLHALPEVPYAPSSRRALAFLTHIDPGRSSFFEHVSRVEPGHIVTVTRDGESSRSWWNPSLEPVHFPRPADYAEALREHLDEAVRARLRGSDGAVATTLSAGLDGSAVTATAARLLEPAKGKVVAFTSVPRAGFDERLWQQRLADEGPVAALAAAHYPNIEHVRIETPEALPLDAIDRQFFLYERPLLNLCNESWISAIYEAAQARGLKVLLTGELGNLTFSYTGEHLLAELLGRGRLVGFAREAALLLRHGHRLKSVGAAALGPFLPRPVWRLFGRFRTIANPLGHSAILRSLASDPAIHRAMAERGFDPDDRPRRDGVQARLLRLRTFDGGNAHKGVLAGWGVDVRDPTADRRLVEYCLRVPTGQFERAGIRRALARAALADRLPAAFLRASERGYQFADWYRAVDAARPDIANAVDRLASIPAVAELVDTARLQRLTREWPEGGVGPGDVLEYRVALLRAVSIGRFLEKTGGFNR